MKKSRAGTYFKGMLIVALSLVGQGTIVAQQSSSTQSSPPNTLTAPAADTGNASAVRVSGDQYRIGPRDVLSIRVNAGRPVPELSFEAIEVDECGRIPLPSVQNEDRNDIQAAGRTREELSEELRTFFLKYKRNPQVIVIVKEYNSQPVAINGAVVKPGLFQMRRPVQLMELVQFHAGGVTDRAGGRIQVARLNNFQMCKGAETTPAPSIEFLSFNLKDTLGGVDASNPYLRPGDVITLPEAKEAYVIGNVIRPGPVSLKDDSMTVSKAIAMSGGLLPDTKKDRIRIIRPDPGSGTSKEILVNYEAINKQKAPDVTLLPNDIVEVQVSGGKRLLRSLVGAVVPSIAQMPMRVIP
jgi:polysaccharide biosynthesis/export protein